MNDKTEDRLTQLINIDIPKDIKRNKYLNAGKFNSFGINDNKLEAFYSNAHWRGMYPVTFALDISK